MKNWLRCLGLGLVLTCLFSLTGCSSENNGSVGISSSLLGGNGIPYSVSAQGLRVIEMDITNTGSQTLNNLRFSFSGKTYGKFFVGFDTLDRNVNLSTIYCSSIPAGQTCKLGISFYAEGSAITAPINQNITLTMSNDVVSTSQTVNITVYPDAYPFATGITNQTFQVVSDYTGVTSVPGFVSDGNEVYPYNFLNSEGGNPYWPFGFSMIPINVFGSEYPLVMSSDGNGMYFLTPTKLYYCLGSAQDANNCQFVALPNGTQNPSEYHLIAYGSVVLLSLDDKAYYIQPGQLTLNEIPFTNGNTYPITSIMAVNVNDIYQSQFPENRIYAYAAQSPTSGMLYEFNP